MQLSASITLFWLIKAARRAEFIILNGIESQKEPISIVRDVCEEADPLILYSNFKIPKKSLELCMDSSDFRMNIDKYFLLMQANIYFNRKMLIDATKALEKVMIQWPNELEARLAQLQSILGRLRICKQIHDPVICQVKLDEFASMMDEIIAG